MSKAEWLDISIKWLGFMPGWSIYLLFLGDLNMMILLVHNFKGFSFALEIKLRGYTIWGVF